MASVDAVVMASAIATGGTSVAMAGSTQEVCDCGGQGCCQGGWPEDAFAYIATKRHIVAAKSYGYWATDGRNCSVSSTAPIAGNVSDFLPLLQLHFFL
jgi:hypothetical protein